MSYFVPVIIAEFLFVLSAAEHQRFSVFKVNEYEMLTFTQSWPQTSCYDLNRKWPNNDGTCSPCKLPKAKNLWTLHGLWPSNRNGHHPYDCNNNAPYSPKLLNETLRTEMQEKWPTFKLGETNDEFWKHEWTKHGTCAMDLHDTSNLPKYFSKALQLLDKYNLGKIFSLSEIIPGKKYSFDDITRVIDNTMGTKTHVKCAVNSKSKGKDQYVDEISICLDKLFRLTDCEKTHITNCSKNKLINYPESLKIC